jgi:hypothetical protein
LEDALSVRPRPDVNRILEHAGNGAVVFGRYEEDRIDWAEPVTKSSPRSGHVLRILVEILIVERKISDLDYLELHILRRDFLHRLSQLEIVRLLAETADQYRYVEISVRHWFLRI